MDDKIGDVAVAAAKASPPVAALGLGLTLNEWVAVLTLCYLALQTGYLVWKWAKEYQAGRKPRRRV